MLGKGIAIGKNKDLNRLIGKKYLNKNKWCSGAGSHTRAIWSGSYNPGTTDNIRFSTYASQGDTIDFGDMTTVGSTNGCCSNPTRMLRGGGNTPSANTNTIDYVMIMTQGNAVDFGDLTQICNSVDAQSNAHGGL